MLSEKEITDLLKVGRERLYPNPTKRTLYEQEREADKLAHVRSTYLRNIKDNLGKDLGKDLGKEIEVSGSKADAFDQPESQVAKELDFDQNARTTS